VSEVPEAILALVGERERARQARDFARADELRDRIREAGFEVTDADSGPVLAARDDAADETPDRVFSLAEDVPSLLDRPAAFGVSVQWVVEGWSEDVRRGIDAFDRRCPGWSVQHVVVDLAPDAPGGWPAHVDAVRMIPPVGWAVARNAGLRRTSAPVVVLVDGSIEPTGDVLSPLVEALADPGVGLTGPFGLVSDDLRDFRASGGPEVDAVEGYLIALRRELLERGLRFDEKFKFYRTADIELSFQVKAMGLRTTVTPVAVRKHEHRMWANTPEEERARLSKRNFYRFLDRWRGRTDLLVSNAP
jgi:cysteinyl-tRNA synthetase